MVAALVGLVVVMLFTGFLGLFAIMALLAIGLSHWQKRKAIEQRRVWEERRQAHPQEPWRWRPEWNDPHGIPAESSSFRRGPTAPRFLPRTLPLPLRGEIAGKIRFPAPVSPQGPARLLLFCQRREIWKGRHEREHTMPINDTVERVADPAQWVHSGQTSQLAVRMPVQGGEMATANPLDPDHPTVEWVLHLRVPTSGGLVDCTFTLPVFEVPGCRAAMDEASSMEEITPAVEPPRLAAPAPPAEPEPVAPATRDGFTDVCRAAGVRIVPAVGAVGGHALLFDPEAAQAAVKAARVGAIMVGMFGGFLGLVGFLVCAVPYVGWLAGIPLLLLAVVCVDSAIAALSVRRDGGEQVWVEDGAIRVATREREPVRIERAAIERLELRPLGGMGTRQLYAIVVAGAPFPGRRRRPRTVVVAAVRTKEAAQMVGQRLSDHLGAPCLPVVTADTGSESFDQWHDLIHCYRRWFVRAGAVLRPGAAPGNVESPPLEKQADRPDPETQEGGFSFRPGLLAGLTLSLMLAAIQGVWVELTAGPDLPAVPYQLSADSRTAEIHEGFVNLHPIQNPVELRLAARCATAAGLGSSTVTWDLRVLNSSRQEVLHWQGSVWCDTGEDSPGTRDSRTRDNTIRRGSGRFEAARPERFSITGNIVSADAPLVAVSLQPRLNAKTSYFMGSIPVLLLGYFVVRWWHTIVRRPTRSGRTPKPAVREPAAEYLPDEAAGIQHGARVASIAAASAFAGPLPWQERLAQRLYLEALHVAVYAIRLPLIGLYAILVMLAFTMLHDTSAGTLTSQIKPVLASETVQSIAHWLLPKNEYHGLEGLIAFGSAAATVLFGFYLLTLPARLLLPRRPRPTFKKKALRLLVFNVGLLAVLSCLLWTARIAPGTSYWQAVAAVAAMCLMLYVPSLVFIAIECWIEGKIEKLETRQRH